MPVKAPSPNGPPSALTWTFVAILCACTLVALWVTAARVKANKLAARYGERIERPAIIVAEDARLPRIVLKRGERLHVEHFILHFPDSGDRLTVQDAKDQPLVEFHRIRKGEQRGWQELRMTFLEAAKDHLTIEAELRPGASSFGPGGYRAIRPGLRVEFDPQRSVTVTAWDPDKPELKLKIDTDGQSEERTLVAEAEARVRGISFCLKKSDPGGWTLLLDGPD